MLIYIDNDYKCHVSDDGTMRSVEVLDFDGKCDAFIEGYCFVPFGETWMREDGKVFEGELLFPWGDYEAMYKAQLEYELEQLKAELEDADNALKVLGVTVNG